MMRVLFTHSYFLRFDAKQWKLMQPYAPLATITAAAWLRQHGYDVSLHDVTFLEHPAAIRDELAAGGYDLLVICDDGFNYLTKMCLTNMREAAFEMIAIAREEGCKVIVSSSDATDHVGSYLQHGADYIVIGEVEQTLLELCNAIRDARDNMQAIPGLAYMTDQQLVRTASRPVLQDLDMLPMAAWDLVRLNDYKKAWLSSTGYFSVNISTTRGCPFKCNWCAKPIYGNRYNARSPKQVVLELKMLQDQYGFDHVWFCDDIFGLKPGWVKKFTDELAAQGLKIRFKIQSRADLLIGDEQVASLAAAGCETVWMGAESGSQRILDAMDKGITVAQIETAVSQLRAVGIRTALFLQFGYLHETKDDIRLTLDMLKRLMPDEIGVSVSYPLPGTKFYEMVKEEMKQKSNWTDSDDLAMMFHGTYDPVFYKRLHRYVHDYYRVLQSRKKASDFNLGSLLRLPVHQLRLLQHRNLLSQ